MVERQLPKLYVEGSIPFARSKDRPSASASGSVAVAASSSSEPVASPASAVLRIAAFLFAGALVAFGGLMWALHGEAVFTDLISAAVAWCF